MSHALSAVQRLRRLTSSAYSSSPLLQAISDPSVEVAERVGLAFTRLAPALTQTQLVKLVKKFLKLSAKPDAGGGGAATTEQAVKAAAEGELVGQEAGASGGGKAIGGAIGLCSLVAAFPFTIEPWFEAPLLALCELSRQRAGGTRCAADRAAARAGGRAAARASARADARAAQGRRR